MPCQRLPLVSSNALSWSRRSDSFSPREWGCGEVSSATASAADAADVMLDRSGGPAPADGCYRALSAVLDAVQTAVGFRLRSGDNLFEHGCTSVKAMRLAAALEIPIAAIFANPTPRGIVRLIAERQHDAHPPPAPAAAVALPTPQPVVAPNKASADAATLARQYYHRVSRPRGSGNPLHAEWRCSCRAAWIAWASSGNSHTPLPI